MREQCFVSTIGTQESPSRRCVFPFEYKVTFEIKYLGYSSLTLMIPNLLIRILIFLLTQGTVYQRCTSDHSANEEQWCATSVARDGSVIIGEESVFLLVQFNICL